MTPREQAEPRLGRALRRAVPGLCGGALPPGQWHPVRSHAEGQCGAGAHGSLQVAQPPRPQASTGAGRRPEAPEAAPHLESEAWVLLAGSAGPLPSFRTLSSPCLKVKTSPHGAFLPATCSLTHGLGGHSVTSHSSSGHVVQQDSLSLKLYHRPPPQSRPWGQVGKAGVVGAMVLAGGTEGRQGRLSAER